uniref:Uncharacterized protein n=1 Tax=Rhipicephalus microplus TaxID=6941 RepID=A0A6G5A265_RHIMP
MNGSTGLASSVKETKSHVIILLFRLLLLLFLFGLRLASCCRRSCCCCSCRCCARCWPRAHTRANVRDEAFQVQAFQRFGKEARPVRLDLDASSLQDGADLLGGDGNLIVLKNQGAVNASELVVGRHGDLMGLLDGADGK